MNKNQKEILWQAVSKHLYIKYGIGYKRISKRLTRNIKLITPNKIATQE